MKAWELLSDKSKWTKSAMARDSSGRPCSARDPMAQSFCMMGALTILYPDPSPSTIAFDKASAAIAKLFNTGGFTWVNDSLGYDAVMQVLREADV